MNLHKVCNHLLIRSWNAMCPDVVQYWGSPMPWAWCIEITWLVLNMLLIMCQYHPSWPHLVWPARWALVTLVLVYMIENKVRLACWSNIPWPTMVVEGPNPYDGRVVACTSKGPAWRYAPCISPTHLLRDGPGMSSNGLWRFVCIWFGNLPKDSLPWSINTSVGALNQLKTWLRNA